MKGNSRWDGLREDRTNSATLSARRRIISRSEGLRHPYHEERNVSAPCDNYFNTTKGDWRKQPNPKNAISLTGEDKKVRLAIQSLKASVAAYVNAFDSSSTKCRHEQAIEKSVNEISLLVFGVADLPGLRKQTNYTSQRQTVITNSVLWNGTESTFNHLKQLRQSSSCELVLKLSYITAAFLQLIKDDIEQSSVANDTAGEFQRPRSMTDLRLCECASILLDFLAGNIHRQGEDVTLLNDCKSALFECLANLLALSALLGYCDCDARNRRRLLFPWGAEKTVDLIVTNSVLPFVNAVMEDGSISISSKCAYCHPAIECLTKLLLNDHLKGSHPRNKQPSNHAAAIMAPLIVDVDQNGEENQKPNPLRSSTLKAITSFWNLAYQLTEMGHTDAIIDYTILACQSLKAALDSLHAFKGGNMHNSGNETPPIEIDVVALCRQIQNALQNVPLTGNQIIFLQLLASLCHSYPSAAARQWHLFLEQPAPYSGGKESSKNAPIFLGYIVDATLVLNERKLQSSSTKMLPDALHTTLMMVSAMPLSYWIMDGSKSKQKISGETYFTSRVQNSILRLIDCTYSLMQTIRDIISGIPHLSNKVIGSIPLLNSIISHTSKLAAMLCSSLPFNDPNAPLLHSASKLVGYSGEIFVSCVKMMGNVTSDYLELVEMAADTFSRVIIDTVDINSTQSISPSQYWLSDCSSYEFLDILLSGGQEIVERKQVVILSQIARICPSAFTREPFNLASFCELCSIQYYDHDLRRKLSGVKLIESFLIGRNVFRESESSDTCEAIVNSICPMLISALEDNEAKIREVAIASLGQLSEPEWSILLYHSRCDGLSCLGWQYVQTILRFSCKKHGENDAKVRSSACKAIGDTSTCIISMPLCTDEFVCLLSQTICHEMENVLNDKHPPVRSMSLFAIGNVAFSLKERFDSGGITLPLLSQLNTSFSSVCSCLDDKDDKVIISAIRAIGHLSYFIYSSNFLEESNHSCTKAKLNLYRYTLTNLSLKVKRAVDNATEGPSLSLNRNQRNNIKKHAWGSCGTIGILLTYSNVLKCINEVNIESILFQLFRCVQFSNIIHNKVATAAVNSLVKLPHSFWQSLSDKNDSIGRGIASCLCCLNRISKQNAPPSSYHEEVQTLMSTLLLGANAKNFCDVFILSETIRFSVGFFYQWLVSCNLEGIPQVMKKISIAVQIEGMQKFVDVSSIQMFMSLTAQLTKERSSPQKCVVSAANNVDDDDDEI